MQTSNTSGTAVPRENDEAGGWRTVQNNTQRNGEYRIPRKPDRPVAPANNPNYRIPRKADRPVAPAKNPSYRTGKQEKTNNHHTRGNAKGHTANPNPNHRIPRKADRPVAPESNPKYRSGKQEKINNHNKRGNAKGHTHSNNSHHGANQEEGVVVLARSEKHADQQALRAALEADLPGKLKFALGGAKLELDGRGDFVVRREAGVRHNYGQLRRILQKQHLPGWMEWLQGRRGWILDTDKQPFLDYHRRLHEAYSVKMLSLMKGADAGMKSALVVLYYKRDPLSLEHDGPPCGARQNTQTLWKKVSRGESLQDAVGLLRPFLEVVRYFCTDPRDKWDALPWLEPDAPPAAVRGRLGAVARLVAALMRSSDWGPDVPVNWAAHPALNHYPRSVVTAATMAELVVGMANILSHLFLPFPATVSTLEGVDALLPRFSSPAAARKGPPRECSTKKNPSSTESAADLPPRPPSLPVDPLVIDLTGLSIADY